MASTGARDGQETIVNKTCAATMALLATFSGAFAQNVSPDEIFRSVFDPFIGDDWLFHIEMYDADGQVTFSGVDLRRFQYGVAGAFLIENVYRPEDEAHIGLQLVGLDRQSGAIHLSTFFPWKPTALASVTARFSDESGVEGTSAAEMPDGSAIYGRFSCKWLERRWTCESFVVQPDGSERISDRNYYCRRSEPTCTAKFE